MADRVFYFEHHFQEPRVELEDGTRVKFSGYGFETRNPDLAERMRRSILCRAREFVEKTFNPFEASRQKVRREKELEAENANLKAQLEALGGTPGSDPASLGSVLQRHDVAAPQEVVRPRRAPMPPRKLGPVIESLSAEPQVEPDHSPLEV